MEMVVEMAMEMQWIPSPQMKWISDLWVTLSTMYLYLWWLCYDFDSGPFTKVAWFDPARKVVWLGGTGGLSPYQWSPDLLMLGSMDSLT
jgi:hypothetical protein